MDLNFLRAFSVINDQSTFVSIRLCCACHAATCSIVVCIESILRFKHWHSITLVSTSTTLNQLPYFGVGGGITPPSSHTTVRTVPYTAVHGKFCNLRTVSYSDPNSELILTISNRLELIDSELELDNTVYALDSSTIDLCLSLFPWAPFRRTKAAVKLHTLLDLRGNIPALIHISDSKLHDVNILDRLLPERDAFYIMDRAYLDFSRLYLMDQTGSYFVLRAKSNTQCQRVYSRPIDHSTGVICDQTVRLYGTNSTELAATTIAEAV